MREMTRIVRRYILVVFYMRGPMRSLKWLAIKRKRMSKCWCWHPVNSKDLCQLFHESGVIVIRKWRVAPLVSDGVAFLLKAT